MTIGDTIDAEHERAAGYKVHYIAPQVERELRALFREELADARASLARIEADIRYPANVEDEDRLKTIVDDLEHEALAHPAATVDAKILEKAIKRAVSRLRGLGDTGSMTFPTAGESIEAIGKYGRDDAVHYIKEAMKSCNDVEFLQLALKCLGEHEKPERKEASDMSASVLIAKACKKGLLVEDNCSLIPSQELAEFLHNEFRAAEEPHFRERRIASIKMSLEQHMPTRRVQKTYSEDFVLVCGWKFGKRRRDHVEAQCP